MDVCRDDNGELPMGDPSMNILMCHLQELPCLILVLLRLEFTIRLTKSACPSLLITNLDPILYNFFEAPSDIHVRLEAIICEECPPLREITYHLQIIWRDRNGELDI